MKTKLTTILFLILILGNGCTEIDKNMQPTVPDQVTYVDHIKPILERSCVRCHNEKVNHYGVILTDYDHVSNLIQIQTGQLLSTILNPEKPANSETGWMYRFLEAAGDYDLFYQWIVEDSLARN